MFGTLKDVTLSPMPNGWHCKGTPSTITRQKLFQGEDNGAFLLLVMLVIRVLPNVRGLRILHKFWFCHDDQRCCVGGIGRKYAIGRLIVPSLWLVQEGTNLTQDEVTTLEEVSFFLSKKPKCHPKNLFDDDAYLLVNKLADANNRPKIRNGKNIHHGSIFKISIK